MMQPPELAFTLSPDVRQLLNELLDRLERRTFSASASISEGRPVRSIKVWLNEIGLPGYYSQIDPEPRQVANEQLQALEKAGLLRLFWQVGEKGHLLEAAALAVSDTGYCLEGVLFDLIGRVPATSLRARLQSQLLGERFRFTREDWQHQAIDTILAKVKENQSPAPFVLADPVFNEDLLLVLAAVSELEEETPFRVFSVRVFNDSKRFEDLKLALIRLARLGRAGWKHLPEDELLRELNLVANPTYLLLAGPWALVDAAGQVLSLSEFNPSVGLAAVQAAHMARVSVPVEQVICVENLTTFHSLAADARMQKSALLCLAGNPSPACRRLLRCLVDSLPAAVLLYIWADLDFGGFNILAQIRKEVSQRFLPYYMDIDTLDQFASYARPLTLTDRRNLERLANHNLLKDVRPVIDHLLKRGLKLEQEAVSI
jgi:hypothetical protein